MSRAKDPKFIEESQKIFKGIKKTGIVISVVLVIFVAYSVVLKKDPEVVTIKNINQEQLQKAMGRNLAPYRERIQELKKSSDSRILSETELQELKWLLLKTKEVRKKTKEKYSLKTTPTKKASLSLQRWKLCWEKKPEYRGESDIRTRCLPAKVLRRSEGYIAISYSFPGGRGVQEGTSTDGISYDGKWEDSTGWGKFHLRFVSSDTAFGWSDDEGRGYKQPNVLSKK